MAGTRRGRPAKPTQAQQLLEALAFVEPATGEQLPQHGYIRLTGNEVRAFNNQMSAGHPIAEELNLCPQLDKFEAALKRCGKSLVISETPTGQLSVKGEKLRALVPCIKDAGELFMPDPDPQVVAVTDQLKEAFKVCGKLANEKGERVMEASVLLEAYTCTGTNGAAILQYFHGIDLPPHMVLPKTFTEAVAKQAKPLTGFGFSWRDGDVATVTFHFEGGAWLKTQCYQDRWSDVGQVLNVNNFPADMPTGLFDAVEAVAEFSDDDWLVFGEGQVMSHADTGVGAQWEVKGLQGGKRFKGKLIKLVAPFVKQIDLTTFPDRAFFFGGEPATNGPVPGTVRGAIIGISTQVTYREPVAPEPDDVDQTADEDGDNEAEGNQEGWGGAQ